MSVLGLIYILVLNILYSIVAMDSITILTIKNIRIHTNTIFTYLTYMWGTRHNIVTEIEGNLVM